MMVMHVAYPQIGTQWERTSKTLILTAMTVVLEVTYQEGISRIDRRGCIFYMYYFTKVATNSNVFVFLDMWVEKARSYVLLFNLTSFIWGQKERSFFSHNGTRSVCREIVWNFYARSCMHLYFTCLCKWRQIQFSLYLCNVKWVADLWYWRLIFAGNRHEIYKEQKSSSEEYQMD